VTSLPVALSQYQEIGGIQWSYMMAGSVIMIIPMLFVFAFG
jgi:ABC-type glycerol-3-phosphate transport system permease component